MKNICVLGSTGSIGTQTLDIAKKSPDINILGLSTNKNIKLLEKQARKFKPKCVCVCDEDAAKELKDSLADTNIRVVSGKKGLIEISCMEDAECVVTAVTGIAGLEPTIEAIKHKKDIALANKETLVAAGEMVMKLAKQNNVNILPVDSEHSAIFQSLAGMQKKEEVKNIILTASGGPFFNKTRTELENVTIQQALNHPNWSMGKKVTIDSATLANKGLEFIEAKWLFDIEPDDIEVIIHPQSIIHSMVRYVDGSVIAQMGIADMRLPIAYALTYPHRKAFVSEQLDFEKYSNLTFYKPDTDTFKALALAKRALKEGGTMSAVFNGADEIAVELFLKEKIKFLDIADVIEDALNAYNNRDAKSLEDVLCADLWAREYVRKSFKI